MKTENRMQELADLIGVKLNERFLLKYANRYHDSDGYVFSDFDKNKRAIFYIDEEGVHSTSECDMNWIITRILTGKLIVIQSDFSAGDTYYVPRPESKSYNKFVWEGYDIDYRIHDLGLACHTPEEADELNKVMLNAVSEYRKNRPHDLER